MKSVIKGLAIGLILLLSNFTNNSYASEWRYSGWVGQSMVDGLDRACVADCTIDDTDTALGINIVYHISDNWGVEAGYIDAGRVSVDGPVSIAGGRTKSLDNAHSDAEIKATYLAATRTYFVGDRWSVTGRLGAAYMDGKVSAGGYSGLTNADVPDMGLTVDGEDIFAGASIDYRVSKSLGLGLRTDVLDDLTVVSLSTRYLFGR